MFAFVPDSPYYKSYWFKDEERLIVLSRKRHDQAGADTHRSVLYWYGGDIDLNVC